MRIYYFGELINEIDLTAKPAQTKTTKYNDIKSAGMESLGHVLNRLDSAATRTWKVHHYQEA